MNHQYAAKIALDLITSQQAQQLLSLSQAPDQLNVTTWLDRDSQKNSIRPGPGSTVPNQNLLDLTIFEKCLARPEYFGPGNFFMAEIPQPLEQQLLNQLPSALLTMIKPPYLRLQRTDRYQLPAHIDTPRSVVLMVVLSQSNVETVFFTATAPHNYFKGVIPDPDLLQEAQRFRFAHNETWLLDTTQIHSTQGIDPRPRVTVNYSWSNVSYQDVLSLLQAHDK